MKRKTVYPWSVSEAVEARIPKEVIEAMAMKGWNVFGVYEIVKDEIRKEKKRQKELAQNGS